MQYAKELVEIQGQEQCTRCVFKHSHNKGYIGSVLVILTNWIGIVGGYNIAAKKCSSL